MTDGTQKPTHLQKLETYLQEQQQKVTINENDIQSHFVMQAPSYLGAAIRYNKAVQVLQQQKTNYDKIVAEVDFEIRNSGEKHTEGSITQRIKQSEKVQKAKNLVLQAEYQANCYQSVVKSWEQKKDMLIQVGSDQRREFKAQTQINKDPDPSGSGPVNKVNNRETHL